MTRQFSVLALWATLFAPAFSQETVSSPETHSPPFELKQAAREAFAAGDLQKGRQRLKSLLQLYRQSYGEPDLGRRAGANLLLSLRLAEVAHEYLRAGELPDALGLLGEAVDLRPPGDQQTHDWLAPAARGVYQRLKTLDAEERYNVLRPWTLPTESRKTVRIWTAVTPADAPPAIFARALGQRPRRDAFAAPVVGGIEGLYCSAWELIRAADEVGRLRRLFNDVSELVVKDVPNAATLLTLIKLKQESEDVAGLEQQLRDAISTTDGPNKAFGEAHLAVAGVCLNQDWSRPIAEGILRSTLDRADGEGVSRRRAFSRWVLAKAIQSRIAESNSNLLANPNLQLWVRAAARRNWQTPHGLSDSVWLAHDDHLLHYAGPGDDYLLLKYPLTGDFCLEFETQNGGQHATDGCLAYNGLGLEALSSGWRLTIWDSSFNPVDRSHCPFIPRTALATFNHYALEHKTDKATVFVNRHPAWSGTSTSNSPWVGVRSFGDQQPTFRNLKLTGDPEIPREVKLVDGKSLRGWVANFYGEETPRPIPASSSIGSFFRRLTAAYDWGAGSGEIHGPKRSDPTRKVAQSRLYYFRPLQDGDSVSYEFRYEPGEKVVHPTLGRIAFLMEPGGIRVHWMTKGDHEWTAIPEDNAVVEPLSRRGPKPLPLVSGEWNQVELSLKRGTLTIQLNETTVYSRRMEPENQRTFGFYHDKNQTEARIRNIVLRGDWPERLTDDQRSNLLALSDDSRTKADRLLLGELLDDKHIHGSVLPLCRKAAEQSVEDRFEFLRDWVLPSVDHSTLRLALDFTPTNPPPMADSILKERNFAEGETRVNIGGEIVSPALDLLSTAKQLGRLEELRRQVEDLSPESAQQQRSRLSMLAMIALAAGDYEEANQRLTDLATRVVKGTHSSFSDRWPETLAILQAAPVAETREAAREMVQHILNNQLRKHVYSGSSSWDQHLRALAARVEHFEYKDQNANRAEPSLTSASREPLANWVPASVQAFKTRGQGFPQSHWEVTKEATIRKFGSHQDDYLFYRIPLRGDFEVECDVQAFGWRETDLWVAGQWVGPVYTMNQYDIGGIWKRRRVPIQPPLLRSGDWVHYRYVVRDGTWTVYYNGRQIHRRSLPTDHDPWIAIRSPYSTDGAARNIRITGSPVVPEEIRLTATPDLSGWMPMNDGNQIGPSAKWRQVGDSAAGGEIRGVRWLDVRDSYREYLLRYHRPMVEDGEIRYQFFYRKGEYHVHPAIDRLAFMLEPDGVRVHWITDGKFDRTGVSPTNSTVEPDNRLGPAALPLKENDWNQLQLSLRGDTVTLSLNGQEIYQRDLELTNQRTFGLFHYADQTEVRVRNVVWRGDWPRELPSLAEQELAKADTGLLADSSSEFPAEFHWSFAEQGYDSDRFGLVEGEIGQLKREPSGLHVTRPGGSGYLDTSIAPNLRIEGDFDVTAHFDQLEAKPEAGGSGGVYLQLFLDSPKANECLLYRRMLRHRATPQSIVQASYVTREPVAVRRDRCDAETTEASGGRIKISRRGDTVYYFFAENDSPNFRLVGIREASGHSIRDIHLVAQAQEAGLTEVVWKSLTVRADRLEGLAVTGRSKAVENLDEQRAALSQELEYDFTKDPVTEELFHLWGPALEQDPNGVRMKSIGSDRWTSSGLSPHIGIEGDFDVALDFDDYKLGTPKENMNSSIYLQIEFPDAAKTQANSILYHHPDGSSQIYSQIRVVDADGNNRYQRVRTDAVEQIDRLRVARRAKRVYLLYRKKGATLDRLLAETDVPELPVPRLHVRALLHTGGDDRESEALLKRLSIKADLITHRPRDPDEVIAALAAQLTDQPPASALQFDGESDYVSIPTLTYNGTDPITLEAFVTPDQLRGALIGDIDGRGVGLRLSPSFDVEAVKAATPFAGVSAEGVMQFQRLHIAGTFDGKTLRAYVNGKLVKREDISEGYEPPKSPLAIGVSPARLEAGVIESFAGVVDAVRISKSLRYTDEFDAPAELVADEYTLALFQCDDGEGAALTDSSGNNNHGEIHGAKWITGDLVRHRAAMGLANLGWRSVPALAAALGHENPKVQMEAIIALSAIGPDARSAVPALQMLVEGENQKVSDAAADAINRIKAKGFLKSILNLFD